MTTAQLLHFIVRNLTYTMTQAGYTIVCYTNNPCHLWLRWTNIVPQKHVNPVITRGAPIGTFIDQCFVVYTDLEQLEPGDTYTHTFVLEPWPICETRWFYFWGTVGGVLSPSRSAIFSKHRAGPDIPPPQCNATALPWGFDGRYNCWFMSSAFTPGKSFHASSVDILVKRWLSTTQCTQGSLSLWSADSLCRPALQLYGPYLFVVPPLAPDAQLIINVPLPNPPIVLNTKYALAYGFIDWTPHMGFKYIGFGSAQTPSCANTPLCARNKYEKFYDRVPDSPCGALLQDWTPYYIQSNLYYQFYGYEEE